MEPTSPAKRILYVITKANWGGAQRYVYDMAVAARSAGHEVSVAYGREGALLTHLTEAGIPFREIAGLRNRFDPRAELRSFFDLLHYLKSEKPDIVHVNSSKGGLALLAARVAGVRRIIFTAHGWAFNENRAWWKKAIFALAYAATVYLSHTTICVSEGVRRDIAWLPFERRKLVTVRHGIDPIEFLPRKEARAALAAGLSEKRWLGMLAELHPSKGIEDALAALRELSGKHPDLALVVLGEGGDRAYLEELARHYGLADRVAFPGFIPHGPRYLKAFDLFLMPSRTEALGYALLEAGRAELPVVASRVGGIPEIVQNKRTGLLVSARHPVLLAQAIETLLTDSALAQEYAAALKERVEKDFSHERMVRETLALYSA